METCDGLKKLAAGPGLFSIALGAAELPGQQVECCRRRGVARGLDRTTGGTLPARAA